MDNESTDSTAQVAQTMGAQVAVVPPGIQARARNAGVAASTGDWIAFVDADCELPPNWLEKCTRHFQRDEVVAVGASMHAPAGAATWVEQCWYNIAHVGDSRQLREVRWLPSFNLVVRRHVFEAINGFDESLITCEDCDLGYRLSARGRLIRDPEPATIHHGESQNLWQLFRREAWRSHGNLRLAVTRFSDWRNWISVLIPVAAVGGLAGAILLGLIATQHGALWPYATLCFALCIPPFALLTARLARHGRLSALPPAIVVLSVYLTARAAGLFISLPRLTRGGE